jgi:arylsulfate sulfotransferase
MKRIVMLLAVALMLNPARAIEISGFDVQMNPSGHAPLTALASFRTDVPATITVKITDGAASEVELGGEPATDHAVPVLGMRPNREHTLTIVATAEDGSSTAVSQGGLTTDPLPDDFPPLAIKVRRSRNMEPGYSLIPMIRWPKEGNDDTYGLAFALDSEGEVVWYYRTDHGVLELTRMRNGNLLYTSGRDGRMFEIDMLGNVIQHWHTTGVPKDDIPDGSIPVAIDTFHHEVIELPSGNFLGLSTEVRDYEDYPTSVENPDEDREPTQVIGDTLVEFKRDGTIVRDWKMLDILDPYRVYHGSLGTGFYAEVYEDVLEKPARDWGHVNAVFYDERDESVLLSFYHQGAAVKFSLKTGEVVWILCESEDWREPWLSKRLQPAGDDVMLNTRQHGIEITPNDTILLYDNGGYREGPLPEGAPEGGNFSRAVEYKVDEEAGTVDEVWAFGGAEDNWFFSPFICDADWMPETGNILITDGGRIADKDGNDTASFAGRHWARIVEVTHEMPARKVFELVIDDPAMGWAVYRSERIPSLYP